MVHSPLGNLYNSLKGQGFSLKDENSHSQDCGLESGLRQCSGLGFVIVLGAIQRRYPGLPGFLCKWAA